MNLALGTAQFGLAYGARKPEAAVDPDQVGRMLAWAWSVGIDMVDTAPAYGRAEAVLAESWPSGALFHVVTKTTYLTDPGGPAEVLDGVRRSFEMMRRRPLWGVLVHHAPDLRGSTGQELFEGLLSLRRDNIVRRIGISVYGPDVLQELLPLYPFDVVQLPLNILDQRFKRSGALADLQERGIEVHARSVFLQGALLVEPSRLPEHLRAAAGRVEMLRRDAAKIGISPAALLFAYAQSCGSISRVVIGADSMPDLINDFAAWHDAYNVRNVDFSVYALDDPCVIDPRQWPQ